MKLRIERLKFCDIPLGFLIYRWLKICQNLSKLALELALFHLWPTYPTYINPFIGLYTLECITWFSDQRHILCDIKVQDFEMNLNFKKKSFYILLLFNKGLVLEKKVNTALWIIFLMCVKPGLSVALRYVIPFVSPSRDIMMKFNARWPKPAWNSRRFIKFIMWLSPYH